jgi:hypothetical protein
MLDSPLPIGLLVVAMVVVAIWVWNRRQAQSDLGDFERRLAEMQRPGGLPAAPPSPPGTPAMPTGVAGAAASDGARPAQDQARETIDDPVLGRLRYYDDQEGGEWEREGAIEIGLASDAWVTVLAGPAGPSDTQRACYQAFAADHAGILARAEALARQAFDARGKQDAAIEAGNFYVYRVTATQERAAGAVVFSLVGNQTDYVSIASDDHWKTLRVEDE